MAIRFNATTDELYRTSNVINYNTPYTICQWIYNIGDTADTYHTLDFMSDDGDFPNVEGLDWRRTTGTTRRLIIYIDNNNSFWETLGTTNLSQNTWYFAAIVRQSNYPGTVNAYLGTLGGSSLTTEATLTSQTGTRSAAAARLQFGTYLTQEVFDGRVAHIKGWSAALTTAELLQEMHSITPKRAVDLRFWLPTLQGDTRTIDYAGLGNFTETGLADEDNPPISWGTGRSRRFFVTGSQQFNQSVDATVGNSFSLIKSAGKIIAVANTPTFTKLATVNKSIAISGTESAAVVKQATKTISSTGESTVTVSTPRIVIQAISASVNSVVTLVKSIAKSIGVSSTEQVTVAKSVDKNISSTAGNTVTIATPRTVIQAISANASSTVTIIKSVGKSIAISAGNTATVIKQVGKIIGATASSALGIIADFIPGGGTTFNQSINATVSTSVTIAKSIQKNVNASVSSVVTSVRAIGKIISPQSTASITIVKSITKTVSINSSVLVQVWKQLAQTITATASTVVSISSQLVAGIIATLHRNIASIGLSIRKTGTISLQTQQDDEVEG